MDASTELKAPPTRLQRSFPALLATTLLLAFSGVSLGAQTVSVTAPAGNENQSMKTFVIIFRQGSKQLTEVELKSRTEETRAWAQRQNTAGHKLDPHILDPEGVRIEPDGGSGPVQTTGAGAITALLFLEARDLAQAADVARAHPGLRYGASVEIRPWAPPPAPPPVAQP